MKLRTLLTPAVCLMVGALVGRFSVPPAVGISPASANSSVPSTIAGAVAPQAKKEEQIINPSDVFPRTPLFRLLDELRAVPVGEEGIYLVNLGEKLMGMLVSRDEVFVISDWISSRNPKAALQWLNSLPEPTVSAYNLADLIIRDVARGAEGASLLLLAFQDPKYKFRTKLPPLYQGLLESDPRQAAIILANAPSNQLNEMQNARVESLIRSGGVSKALEQLPSLSGLSQTTGNSNTSISGTGVNYLGQLFRTLKSVPNVDNDLLFSKVLDSPWFGGDSLMTTAALRGLASFDAERTLRMAEDATRSHNVTDSRFVTAAFKQWSEADPSAALAYLNSKGPASPNLPLYVDALYQTSKDPTILAECKEIMVSNGWEVPNSK